MRPFLSLLVLVLADRAGAVASFAYSVNEDHTVSTGVAYNQPNFTVADQKAIANCQKPGHDGLHCAVVRRVNDGCWALAATNFDMVQSGEYEIASGANKMQAGKIALNNCIANYPSGVCAVRASFCETNTVPKPVVPATPPWYDQSRSIPFDTIKLNTFLTGAPGNPNGYPNYDGYSNVTSPQYCRDPIGYNACMTKPNPFTGGPNTVFCQNNFC